MRLFIVKMMAILMSLICVLLVEGILMETISFIFGIALLLACSILAWQLLRFSVGLERRRARRKRTAYLQVANGAKRPHGPKAA